VGPHIRPPPDEGEACSKYGWDRFRNVDLYKVQTNKQTNKTKKKKPILSLYIYMISSQPVTLYYGCYWSSIWQLQTARTAFSIQESVQLTGIYMDMRNYVNIRTATNVVLRDMDCKSFKIICFISFIFYYTLPFLFNLFYCSYRLYLTNSVKWLHFSFNLINNTVIILNRVNRGLSPFIFLFV